MSVTTALPPLRRHQGEAMAALEEAWGQGRTRAWVVLPPGAGKTRVGLESVARRQDISRAVVFAPNTAIQVQWEQQAQALGIDAGTDRSLGSTLTALTYQGLAIFDPDAEVDDEGEETSMLARLHENGRALVDTLRGAGPILLVLDECHHLLEVWGRLLGELLDELPEAHVLGLTATPPEALTGEQAALVQTLFGESVYATSIPAVVREGDLAPFAELAWLTVPTPTERAWLRNEAVRFTGLVTQLLDPGFGSTAFLTWLDLRFLTEDVRWSTLQRKHPELCDAALRMHHEGLLALPPGARVLEQHRHPPTPEDWVTLIEDWVRRALARDGDDEVREALRRALPSVGYQLTRRGIRRGRTPVDRVLARSASKMRAATRIVAHEHANLGDRLRALVLCDHEEASAMLPADLHGVIDRQSGSARAVLAHLLDDPATAPLRPLMVTGRTVAGAPEALSDLRSYAVARGRAGLGALDVVEAGDGSATLSGAWTSRTWVPLVTAYFQDGHCQALIGTRALLGEGWDANRITSLVDLSTATTTTAVVQTRGRALRIDPEWPEKVAVNWSLACVGDDHPKAHNDWERLVRKHRGFLSVDPDGDVVDGVAHIDPALSPYAPPATADFDALNARMLLAAEDRDGVRERWRVGTPYDDALAHTIRVRVSRQRLSPATEPSPVVAGPTGLVLRDGSPPAPGPMPALSVLLAVALAVAGLAGQVWWLVALASPGALAAGAWWRSTRLAHRRELLALAARPPGIGQFGRAVADGLHATGQTSVGASGVRVDIDHDGRYRCHLDGVAEAESALFAEAVDELLSPLLDPRYVIPRHQPPRPGDDVPEATWFQVPTALGRNADHAKAFAAGWHAWVGPGDPLYTRSAEGVGVLAAHAGVDPLGATSVLRRGWS